MSPPWLANVGSSLRTQTATWFVGVLIAILSLFSSKLTDTIKAALNRADLRTNSFEQIARDLSEYVFVTELVQEYLQGGFTGAAAIEPTVKDYTDSITKLRKNELVYRSWLARYWSARDLNTFSRVMNDVRGLDHVVHELNGELDLIARKKKEEIDGTRAKDVAAKMTPVLDQLRSEVQTLLMPAA
jgi:hypothetical protein